MHCWHLLSLQCTVCRKLAESGKKKTKRKKKSCRSSETGSAAVATSVPDDTDTEQPATPRSGLDSDSTDAWTEPQPPHTTDPTHKTYAPQNDSTNTASHTHVNSAHHSRSSSASAEPESEASASGLSPAQLEPLQAKLLEAGSQASAAIEIGAAAGDDVLQQLLNALDAAITAASQHGISVKHSRKVRARLQLLLHEAITMALSNGDAAVPAASSRPTSTAQHSYQWQKAGAKPTRPPSSKPNPPLSLPGSAARLQANGNNHSNLLHPAQQQQQIAFQHRSSEGVVPPPPPPRQPPTQSAAGHQQAAGVGQRQHQRAVSNQGSEQPPGHASVKPTTSRGGSGNAWGVATKHRAPAQVKCLDELLERKHWPIWAP